VPRRPSLAFPIRGPARCELAFTAPFAALGGGLYGVEVAPWIGVPAPVASIVAATALVGFVAFQITLEPWAVFRFGGADGRWGPLVAYLWDAVTGTAVGLPLVAVLDFPAGTGVGAAVSVGAAYGYVMGFVVCGEGAEFAVRTLFGGGGGRHRPQHSYAQALEQQGRLDEALAVYREARAADAGDPAPGLAMARILQRKGDAAGAVDALRETLTSTELTPEQEVLTLRRMADLWTGLDRQEAMAPELARYLERSPGGPGAEWARRELADIKSMLARRLGLGELETSDP
jgi:hypothetical protein